MRKLNPCCGLLAALLLAATACAAAPAAPAEPGKGVPNAVQGFSQNQGKPIQIEAAQLEVHDKDKVATFSGDVHVIQGDTDLRCNHLVVFYEDDNPPVRNDKTPRKAKVQPAAQQPQQPLGGGQRSQQVKRLEAKGNVIVTQKDQVVTGEAGIYDLRSNVVTMTGNVVLTKGPDVIRGDRLVVDMTTGVSKVDTTGGPTHGPVRAIFNSGSMKEMKESGPTGEATKPSPTRPGR